MNTITIEKNVPRPSVYRMRTIKYPFAQMEVGDSFVVPVPKNNDAVTFAANVRTSSHQWGSPNGVKFSVLLVDGKTSVRVWRVA